MISAKLITNRGSFDIVLMGSPSKEAALDHIKKTIETGGVFYGDHDILFLAPDVIVSVIEIREATDITQQVEEAVEGDDGPVMGLVHDVLNTTYLGQKLRISYTEYNVPGHTYSIITRINRDDPFNSLGLPNLIKLGQIFTLAATQDLAITAVTPPSSLGDADEYVEYLKDYVKEAYQPQETKNDDAKAWQGWKDKINE